MKEQKERLIKRLNHMQKLIPDTILAMQELPELEFLHMYTTLNPGELQLQMDYNIKKYKILRRELAGEWKCRKKSFNEIMGTYFVEFRHKYLNVTLDVQLDMNTEPFAGQSCKLVEVGKRLPQSIYEVICDDL